MKLRNHYMYLNWLETITLSNNNNNNSRFRLLGFLGSTVDESIDLRCAVTNDERNG